MALHLTSANANVLKHLVQNRHYAVWVGPFRGCYFPTSTLDEYTAKANETRAEETADSNKRAGNEADAEPAKKQRKTDDCFVTSSTPERTRGIEQNNVGLSMLFQEAKNKQSDENKKPPETNDAIHITPSDNDVLLGSDVRDHSHIGTARYMDMMKQHQTKPACKRAPDVVKKVEAEGGRFLQWNPDTSQYDVMSKKQAIEMTQEQLEEIHDDIAALTNSGLNLEYASPELQDNVQFVTEAVNQYGGELRYASEELQNNEQVVTVAVTQEGCALDYASEELRNNKQVVTVAVTQNGEALYYASSELQGNAEVVSAAVTEYGPALEWASYRMRDNEQVVTAAVTEYGLALGYASEDLKNNKQVVTAAVTQDGLALRYASEELRGDCLIVRAAVAQNPMASKYSLE